MKFITHAIVLLATTLLGYTAAELNLNQGHWIPDDVHVEVSPRKKKEGHAVPDSFSWSNKDGVNYLTNNRNQHIPQYCGSCWAHAATYVMSDRIKIQRKAAWPDINISPQVLLSCDKVNRGCSGGWPLLAFKYMNESGITDETCSPYQSRGHRNGLDCSPLVECMSCSPSKGCFPVEEYKKYFIYDYGFVAGEADMMEEVSAWGPIACTVAVTPALHEYTGGIFIDDTGRKNRDHEVEIVGYGEENGVKFWEIRNSWGSNWGENGFFRLVRGVDNLGIETNCSWAGPRDTWSEGKEYIHRISEEQKKEYLKEKLYNSIKQQLTIPMNKGELDKQACRIEKAEFENGEKVISPRPHELLKGDGLPKNFDWRNRNGVNYLSWNTNQHAPHHCGACWAKATTSSLADRINIKAKRTDLIIALNPQVVINCKGGGSCSGGNPAKVYEFAHTAGIPDNTCMNYEGIDTVSATCDPFYVCRDCKGPAPPPEETGFDNCWNIEKFKTYFVSEYGHVKGADNMKAEIFSRGPISCGIRSTPKFEAYKGGIYSESTFSTVLNHEVSVVGWGTTEDGQEYWIGRNSWGTYWGEGGFFRINMHSYNLGITTDCTWGVPVTDPTEQETYMKRKYTIFQ